MDLDAVIQLGIIIGIIVAGFLTLFFLGVCATKALDKIEDIRDYFETITVAPFSLARIYIIGIFVDLMIYLKIKDFDHIPLYILIAVILNCLIMFFMEDNKKRYAVRNTICGIAIFVIAPVFWIIHTVLFVLAFIPFSLDDGKAPHSYGGGGGGGGGVSSYPASTPYDAPQFQEQYDPTLGKYYSDGHGNIRDADGNDVNPWDKPYWMP